MQGNGVQLSERIWDIRSITHCVLTVFFSLQVKSSLSRMSSSLFRRRIRLDDRRPPNSSSAPGNTIQNKINVKWKKLFLPLFDTIMLRVSIHVCLPLSSFSSFVFSITTNFSQTANVGNVEEINCPNLQKQNPQKLTGISQRKSVLHRSIARLFKAVQVRAQKNVKFYDTALWLVCNDISIYCIS